MSVAIVSAALALGLAIMLLGRRFVVRRVAPESFAVLYSTLGFYFVAIFVTFGLTVDGSNDALESFAVATALGIVMLIVLFRDGRRVGMLRGTWPEK